MQRVVIRLDASGSFLTILRWCLRFAKDAQNDVTLHSVLRRIFASGFRAGFVISFRWIPSELNYAEKGSRFFGRDHDPSKALLHVLA